MIKDQIVISIPVKNVVNSKKFYTKLGFRTPSGDNYCCLRLENTSIMLYDEPSFKELLPYDISNTKQGKEVFFGIELESKEELYELATYVKNAGGTIDKEPNGFDGGELTFHSFRFIDLDGYLWGVSYSHLNI